MATTKLDTGSTNMSNTTSDMDLIMSSLVPAGNCNCVLHFASFGFGGNYVLHVIANQSF